MDQIHDGLDGVKVIFGEHERARRESGKRVHAAQLDDVELFPGPGQVMPSFGRDQVQVPALKQPGGEVPVAALEQFDHRGVNVHADDPPRARVLGDQGVDPSADSDNQHRTRPPPDCVGRPLEVIIEQRVICRAPVHVDQRCRRRGILKNWKDPRQRPLVGVRNPAAEVGPLESGRRDVHAANDVPGGIDNLVLPRS